MSRFRINEQLVYFDEVSSVLKCGYFNKIDGKNNLYEVVCSPKWTNDYPFVIYKGDIITIENKSKFRVIEIVGFEKTENRFSPSICFVAEKINK